MAVPEDPESKPPKSSRKPFLLGCLAGGVASPLLIVAAVLLGAWLYKPYSAARIAENMRPPTLPRADFAWTLETAEGGEFPLSALEGRPFLVALWMPDCPACKAELPTIQALADAVADTDVAFLPVAVEKRDDLAEAAALAGLTMPYYVSPGKLPDAFRPRSIPTVYVVDRSGAIVMSHTGATKWDDASVVAYIRGLASQPG